jgi:hypothetical protein
MTAIRTARRAREDVQDLGPGDHPEQLFPGDDPYRWSAAGQRLRQRADCCPRRRGTGSSSGGAGAIHL